MIQKIIRLLAILSICYVVQQITADDFTTDRRFDIFSVIAPDGTSAPSISVDAANNDIAALQAFHEAGAKYALSLGPASFAALTDSPISLLKTQNTNVFQLLAPFRSNDRIGPSLFMAGNYDPLLEWGTIDHGDGWDVTSGIIYDFANSSFGAAYGYSRTNGDWYHSDEAFQLRANTALFFASHRQPRWYANAILNYSWLDYAVDHKHHTSGRQWGTALNMAYYAWIHNDWKTGPILNVEYQDIALNEVDHPRESWITGLGWQVITERKTSWGSLIGNIYGAFNKEWDTPSFQLRRRRGDFATFGTGFTNTFPSELELSLSYNGWLGSHHINSHVVSLALSYPIPCQ